MRKLEQLLQDNPRAPTPDTESEQPTDTELSESKTTPETNVSTEDVSIAGTSANSNDKLPNDEPEAPIDSKELIVSEDDEDRVKPINKLDQALTNVIENLIIVDRSNGNSSRISISSSENEEGSTVSSTSTSEPEVNEKCDFRHCQDNYEDVVTRINEATDSSESLNISLADATSEPSTSTVSVFSIGPFPSSASPPSTKSVQFSDPLIVGPSVQAALPVFGEVLLDTKNLLETTAIDDKTCSSVHGGEIEEEAAQHRLVAGLSDSERMSQRSQGEMHVEKEKMDNRVEDCSSNYEESIESKGNKLPEISTTKSSAIGEEIQEQKVENCVASGSSSLEDAAGSSRKELPELVSSSVNAASISSPSTSDTLSEASAKPARSHEEVLAARAARLRRLEEQADWLMKKMNATSRRGSALCNRLEELHEVYGEAPVPPPMPDVLPTVRIPLETRTRQVLKFHFSFFSIFNELFRTICFFFFWVNKKELWKNFPLEFQTEDDERDKSRHDKKPPPGSPWGLDKFDDGKINPRRA